MLTLRQIKNDHINGLGLYKYMGLKLTDFEALDLSKFFVSYFVVQYLKTFSIPPIKLFVRVYKIVNLFNK